MDVVLPAACGLLGLLLGSFANVVIHRMPTGASLLRPASACPGCASPIAPRDNVPVVSWLLLRGRCRRCGTRISARYPLVELGMAVLFAVVGARVGWDPALPGYLLYAWTLLVIAVIDARTRRIPNRLTYPLTPALLVLLALAAVVHGQPGWAGRAALAGLTACGLLLGLALVNPRGMGMGDVKLAAFVGVGLGYLGWVELVVGVFGAFLLGGAVGAGLLAARVRTRADQIPFGPYLSLGALVAVVAGQPVADAYIRLAGL
jgi:leader peptidase (prepilin peptidase) / N-methyltransferase